VQFQVAAYVASNGGAWTMQPSFVTWLAAGERLVIGRPSKIPSGLPGGLPPCTYHVDLGDGRLGTPASALIAQVKQDRLLAWAATSSRVWRLWAGDVYPSRGSVHMPSEVQYLDVEQTIYAGPAGLAASPDDKMKFKPAQTPSAALKVLARYEARPSVAGAACGTEGLTGSFYQEAVLPQEHALVHAIGEHLRGHSQKTDAIALVAVMQGNPNRKVTFDDIEQDLGCSNAFLFGTALWRELREVAVAKKVPLETFVQFFGVEPKKRTLTKFADLVAALELMDAIPDDRLQWARQRITLIAESKASGVQAGEKRERSW